MNESQILPKVGLLEMLRLGLFQMGLGIMSLLTLGLLNRVMINELAIPPTIAAGLISIPLFVAPARVWFGQLSDSKLLWGYHRTGYVWLGSLLFTSCAFLAVQGMWQFGENLHRSGWGISTIIWVSILGLLFACYGFALSMSSTPFAALLVDVSDEKERPQLVGVVWSLLMVGIVIGAITVGSLLGSPTEEKVRDIVSIFQNPDRFANLRNSINRIFMIIPPIVVGLTFAATWGIEQKFSRFRSRLRDAIKTDREDQVSLGRALRILTASPQTAKFFVFLLSMTLGLFMQDAVLEPYGGEIFGMGIAETTKLNAPYGIGTLLGISLGGFVVAPRVGKQNTACIGCMGAIGGLVLLLLVGWSANPNYLKGIVFLFGLASGITTTGAVSLMLDLTAVATAGTFIGAWGLAQAIARGMATLLGGVALDLGKLLFPIPVLSYGLVFGFQMGMLVIAIILLRRVNVKEFQATTQRAVLEVMVSEVE